MLPTGAGKVWVGGRDGSVAGQGGAWYYPYDGGGAALILACTIMCVCVHPVVQ